jgi:hypothetical protein
MRIEPYIRLNPETVNRGNGEPGKKALSPPLPFSPSPFHGYLESDRSKYAAYIDRRFDSRY